MLPLFEGNPAYNLAPTTGSEAYCEEFAKEHPEILKLLKGKYTGASPEERYAQFLAVKKITHPTARGKWSILFEYFQ